MTALSLRPRCRSVGRTSVLASFEEYFHPDRPAPRAHYSTGQIAAHMHRVLQGRGPVDYVGERAHGGLRADVFVGHFWSFAEYVQRNRFGRSVAFYPVADPAWTRAVLTPLAAELGVPVPEWDLPPAGFDHEATMELADLVVLVGNRTTLATFPARWRSKIRLLNYAPDERVHLPSPRPRPRDDFCYVATWCDLRKGFMDVLDTWDQAPLGNAASSSRLHVIGGLKAPWRRLVERRGIPALVYHGFVDSHTAAFRALVRACRFAHIPTWSEGQMGTLLEVAAQGCVPLTTAISGVDEEVLRHCLVVRPRDIAGQRAALAEALSWPPDQYARRRRALRAAVRRHHSWDAFERGFAAALEEVS
ncbi:MAG: glycosyltransferase [Actinobacteria bacterium]|nr:glycosyltransferase [Actinomycetota bacterium]